MMHCFAFQLQIANALQNLATEISPYVIWGFIGITVCVIIVDIFLYTNGVEGDTISNIVRDWSHGRGFVLPFIWGVLATHFFLVGSVSSHTVLGWCIITAIIICMILIGIFRKPKVTPFSQVIMLVFGVTASFLLTF
jgi:hypothetical protein